MLPLTPANNYTATILFCGGSDVQPDRCACSFVMKVWSLIDDFIRFRWTSPNFIIPTYAASASCVKITPDVSGKYEKEDALPDARTMANFIALPDGRILNLNGGKMGMKAILPFESTFSYWLRSPNRNGRLR